MTPMADNPFDPRLDSSTVETSMRQRPARPRVLALTILAHPDWQRVGERRKLAGDGGAWRTEISRLAPLFANEQPLLYPSLSRSPCLAIQARADGSALLERLAGADILVAGKPFGETAAFTAATLDAGLTLVLARRIALLLHRVELFAPAPRARHGLRGESDALLRLCCDIDKAAALEGCVLLRGESGSGKELVARALHQGSARAAQPYVAVNLGAVPAELAAAELFGVERGAFTGAEKRRLGFFRQAEGGTLFLDEIGAAPPALQDLLLRALENQQIQPIGHERTLEVDVRVLAATDLELEAAVRDGRFRAPLWHRLRAWEIRLPALRDRRDDIARLLHHFLAEELAELGASDKAGDPGPRSWPWLPAELVAELVAADWPGNVRELRNLARQLAIKGHDEPVAEIAPGLFARASQPSDPWGATVEIETAAAPRAYRRPDSISNEELVEALRRSRWQIQATADTLGVSRTSLYSLIDKCPAIRKASEIPREELTEALAAFGPEADLKQLAATLEVSYRGLLLRLRELGLGRETEAAD